MKRFAASQLGIAGYTSAFHLRSYSMQSHSSRLVASRTGQTGYWIKGGRNLGYNGNVDHEHILICGRGASAPKVHDTVLQNISSVIYAPKGKHSEKPTELYERFELLHPNGRYLDLFGGKPRERWTRWCHDVDPK